MLFDYLIGIFCRNGRPLPGNYVTAKADFCDKYIYHSTSGDIHGKDILKHFSGEAFFPETFFPREKVISEKENSLFFLKNIKKDNGEGIKLLKYQDIPPIVPNNHILQPEIETELYHKRKFDIRVLVCVKRTGEIMIYKNLLYKVNPNIFTRPSGETVDISNYVNHSSVHGDNSIGFFEKTHPGELDIENYLRQLEHIIPRIYSKFLPISNTGYYDALDESFIFGGLDFIQEKNSNKLLFIELNVTPGWVRDFGLENYQTFYHLATDFILDKEHNSDECIYTSIKTSDK